MPTYNARTAGIYRARFLGTKEHSFENEETHELEPRWMWRFQEVSDPTTVGEISKWTGTNMKSANANAHKIASGIVGRKLQPGDDTDQYIGGLYDVVYGPNQGGTLTITSVVRVQETAESDPPGVSTAPAPWDNLPF